MSTANQNTKAQAEMLLMESVAVPAFTQKLASAGVVPTDEADHVDFRVLADCIAKTAHEFLAKRARLESEQHKTTVKAAIDTAFSVAGRHRPSKGNSPTPAQVSDEFFKLAGVADAAALLTAKVAEESCPGTPAPMKAPEPELEDEKKDAAKTVVAA